MITLALSYSHSQRINVRCIRIDFKICMELYVIFDFFLCIFLWRSFMKFRLDIQKTYFKKKNTFYIIISLAWNGHFSTPFSSNFFILCRKVPKNQFNCSNLWRLPSICASFYIELGWHFRLDLMRNFRVSNLCTVRAC